MMIFQTNDTNKVVTICAGDDVASVENANSVQHGGFNLVNTCTSATMRKVREAAKGAGLKLRDAKTMAVR